MTRWHIYVGGTLLVTGLMSVGAAVLNLDVFFEHPTAAAIVRKHGRIGARIFYLLLGTVFAGTGAVILLMGWNSE